VDRQRLPAAQDLAEEVPEEPDLSRIDGAEAQGQTRTMPRHIGMSGGGREQDDTRSAIVREGTQSSEAGVVANHGHHVASD